MRALRPQYAYLSAHRQSNPLHPRFSAGRSRPVVFCTIIIHDLVRKVNGFRAFSCLFLFMQHLFDRSAVFLPREQAQDIFMMRAPGQQVEGENHRKDRRDIAVIQLRAISEPKNDALPEGKARHAEKRPHRTPFGSHDVKGDQPKAAEADEEKPGVFAAEIDPEQPQRRSDPLSAAKFHRDGKDVPDDDAQPAEIPGEIGDDDVRPRKHISAIDEITDQRGDPALERVAEKGDDADFQAELPAHVHRAGVAAAHFPDVLMLDLRDEHRKVKAADKIADDRQNYKLIPILRQAPFFHFPSPSVGMILKKTHPGLRRALLFRRFRRSVPALLRSVVLFFLPRGDADGRARKVVCRADGVFQIAFVGKMQKPRVVDEQRERRRADADLRREIHLHPPSLVRRGRIKAHGVPQKIVQRPRGDAEGSVRVHLFRRRKDFVHPLPRLCRNVHRFVIVHEFEIGFQLFFELIDGMRVLFDEIPFVHEDDGGLALLVHEADDLDVLFGQPFRAVHDEQTDVAPADGVEGAHVAVIFDVVLHPALLADACRIDEGVFLSVPLEQRVDGVAGRPRNRRDDAALLSQKAVDEAGFARVRLADHRDFQRFDRFGIVFRKQLHRLVQHVADPPGMFRGNGVRLSQAQRIELEHLFGGIVVDFVDD